MNEETMFQEAMSQSPDERAAFQLRIESSLDSLRDREDFRHLMMDEAFPTEPFAQGR